MADTGEHNILDGVEVTIEHETGADEVLAFVTEAPDLRATGPTEADAVAMLRRRVWREHKELFRALLAAGRVRRDRD